MQLKPESILQAVILIGLSVGILAGMFNGFFITKLGMPAIAVTLATQSLFRGISQAVLEDHAYTTYPESFAYFRAGVCGGFSHPL